MSSPYVLRCMKFMKSLGYMLGLNIALQKFNIRMTNMYLI